MDFFLTNFVGNQPQHDQRYEEEQTNGHHEMESHMEQGYSEVDQLEQERFHQEQMQMQQQQQHVQQMNGAPERSEVDHVSIHLFKCTLNETRAKISLIPIACLSKGFHITRIPQSPGHQIHRSSDTLILKSSDLIPKSS